MPGRVARKERAEALNGPFYDPNKSRALDSTQHQPRRSSVSQTALLAGKGLGAHQLAGLSRLQDLRLGTRSPACWQPPAPNVPPAMALIAAEDLIAVNPWHASRFGQSGAGGGCRDPAVPRGRGRVRRLADGPAEIRQVKCAGSMVSAKVRTSRRVTVPVVNGTRQRLSAGVTKTGSEL